MATPDVIDRAEWVRAVEARRVSGLSHTNLTALALGGRIRVMALPGTPIRYHRGDCHLVRCELAGETAAEAHVQVPA